MTSLRSKIGDAADSRSGLRSMINTATAIVALGLLLALSAAVSAFAFLLFEMASNGFPGVM